MFKIWPLRFILKYPTHSHDHATPKLGLTLQNQYCFSKWDTTGNASAKMKTFVTDRHMALWTSILYYYNYLGDLNKETYVVFCSFTTDRSNADPLFQFFFVRR